jgi:4-hydroxybenzoate polyprenyltransferase
MRPRTFPATFAMALTGYAIAPARPGDAGALTLDLAHLFTVHSVLLWGGVNAFNSSQDRDEGPVNLLRHPPPLPPGLLAFSLLSQAAAVGLAALHGWWPAALVATAVALSTLYSLRVPRFRRAKEIPVLDILINALGCGLGSIALGYAFTGASPLDARALSVGLAFSVAIFGGLPTSQIFQLEPGEARGRAHNYASLLGARRTLRVGSLFFALHLALLATVVRPGWTEVSAWSLPMALWIGWAVLVTAGALHSLWWSAHPFTDAYGRMTRQFAVLMGSQVLWTAAAWLA